MVDLSKISRNNKKRGRGFEVKVASVLEWTRVPFSGAVREWGLGDVLDGFFKKKGYWAGECKTQQPGPRGTISVKQKWIEQVERATTKDRRGILITRNVGDTRIYVLMRADSFKIIDEMLLSSERELLVERDHLTAAGLGMGFVVPLKYLTEVHGLGNISTFSVMSKKLEHYDDWFLMTLDTFKRIIDKHHLMEHDDADAQDGQ